MKETSLQEVLEEYAITSPEGNNLQSLQRMIEEYPQFAAELEDFAAARALIKYAPEAEVSEMEQTRYREIGLQNLRTILSEQKIRQNALESLTSAAKEKGLSRSKFAAAVGLSVSLVQYLEKRRLDFTSIPKTIISKVAEVLETGEELVANYLNQPPVSAANASFKTSERPEELNPKSFMEAVREDQQLSENEKRKLLEM